MVLSTGEGLTFWDRKKTRVSCEECGGAMATSSLRHHIERSHFIVLPSIIALDLRGKGPETYKVLFLRILNLVE